MQRVIKCAAFMAIGSAIYIVVSNIKK